MASQVAPQSVPSSTLSNGSSSVPPNGTNSNTLPYLVPSYKVDYDKLKEFEFQPPPECPVFHPTSAEWAQGPLEYIRHIRNEAEPHGICKIIPPKVSCLQQIYVLPFNNNQFVKEFRVPFAIDIKQFKFAPRIQRLNELEALTRIKLHFQDRIHKFWDLQVCFAT